MPKIIEDTQLQELNNRMKELLSSYGADKLTMSIQSLSLPFHPFQKTPTIESDVMLADAVESFFVSSNFLELSKTSQTTYRSEMKLFLQYVRQHYGNHAQFQTITNGELLSDYINQYPDQNTKAKKCAFLRTFIKTTYKKFYGHQDLDHLKKVLKVRWSNDDMPKAFTKAQIAEILMIAQSRNHGALYTAIIWTFLGSGIRINELCHLQIGDIDPHTQTLKVVPKGAESTKKSRKINQLALLMLADYIEKKYSKARETLSESEYKQLYVFSSTGGKKPLTPRAIQHFMKSIILETQSIPAEDKERLGPHSFRHTFAVQGLDAGIDIYTLAKLLGHESLNSTMKYLRMFDDQLKHAINKHPFAREVMKQIKERLENR